MILANGGKPMSNRLHKQLKGATSVIGYLDRVTGVMWATIVRQAGENEIIGAETYDLSCKIIDRLL
jgi:hypothetical protein